MIWYKENEKIGDADDVISYLESHDMLEQAIIDYVKENYDTEDMLHEIWYNGETFSVDSMRTNIKDVLNDNSSFEVKDKNGDTQYFEEKDIKMTIEIEVIIESKDDVDESSLRTRLCNEICNEVGDCDVQNIDITIEDD